MEEVEKRKRGHQKCVPNPNGGRKKTGVKRISFNVSCQPEELEQIKLLAKNANKSVSRFLLDSAFGR